MDAPDIKEVDWLDKILITAVNGKPGDDWPDRAKAIYWSRISDNPRVQAAKEAIMKQIDAPDSTDLAQQIRTMGPKSELYRTLKTELSARGWWKNRPRGKPDHDINRRRS